MSVRTREFVQDFFLNQNTFFNTSMASRRMEYIYYNAMMTNAIGFVWIHIDRSFSSSFEGIWTNTQQITWFLKFCFILIFVKFQCTDEKSSSDDFFSLKFFGCIKECRIVFLLKTAFECKRRFRYECKFKQFFVCCYLVLVLVLHFAI